MYRASYRSVGAIAIALSGCASVSNDPVADPAIALNETVFRCRVEPILARQCSFNACHGVAIVPPNAGSPLRVYTPGKLRATPPANIDAAIAPLSVAEEHANFESAAGFNYGITSVDDNWLLRKPLTPSEGGYSHKGGVIFSGGGDPQYGTIRAWLLGTGSCN